jgi:hypothetical protein
MELLFLLLLLSGVKGGKPAAPKPGQETIIRARDGSSHRVRFVTAVDKATGKSASGWIALSTDTAVRFKENEAATILGRAYRWRKSPGGTFTGGAFI